MEHRIDCGGNSAAACHSAEYVTALFRGQHINYDHEPAQEMVWAHSVKDRVMVDLPMPQVRWGVGRDAAHTHGCIKYVGLRSLVINVVSGWDQHITAIPQQLLFLPLETCQWLLTNQPAQWQQMTVVPGNVTPKYDNPTGLDTVDMVSTAVWGITASGQPYFTSDGDLGSGEGAQLLVASDNTSPLLIQ